SVASRPRARVRTRPGRPANRQPVEVASTGRSSSSAAVRPVRSAPTPRAGSSARWGTSGSSPTTIRIASAGSVPGMDPVPVAQAGGHGSRVRALGSGPPLAGPVLAGPVLADPVLESDTVLSLDRVIPGRAGGTRPAW